jgi:hypothetical protein
MVGGNLDSSLNFSLQYGQENWSGPLLGNELPKPYCIVAIHRKKSFVQSIKRLMPDECRNT